ncbi:hypothetical protein FisN_20Lh086 [Fistulifera solaris]|uniref:MYND-type domain-containing protein n=1 Tax=Fistulifera solaris TaxID=1519565 RepID=A0A1Z5JCY4_FISSO|nr:hypothetical protein FisN_20Lh086 [Fistulifera solaris]|eukprot:GAX11857.1 hypothetical protein FisN_20Lh086 [Fistulifera solaris]
MPAEHHLCAVCQQEATQRCSRCQETWYCSVEHQRQDWKEHKANVCLVEDPRVLQLVEAITNNNRAVVEELASVPTVLNGKVASYNPSGRPLRKWAPLHECVRAENLDLLQLLLQKQPKLEVKDGDGETPLFIAASAREPRIVRALLTAGANPNACGNDGWSALMMATRNADLETVQAFFDSGVDVYAGHDMFGRSAVDFAQALATGQGLSVCEGEDFEEVLERARQMPALYQAYLRA